MRVLCFLYWLGAEFELFGTECTLASAECAFIYKGEIVLTIDRVPKMHWSVPKVQLIKPSAESVRNRLIHVSKILFAIVERALTSPIHLFIFGLVVNDTFWICAKCIFCLVWGNNIDDFEQGKPQSFLRFECWVSDCLIYHM